MCVGCRAKLQLFGEKRQHEQRLRVREKYIRSTRARVADAAFRGAQKQSEPHRDLKLRIDDVQRIITTRDIIRDFAYLTTFLVCFFCKIAAIEATHRQKSHLSVTFEGSLFVS